MRVVKHIMLWVITMILFTSASFGVELLEGNKISTTEYYGFRNIGIAYLFLIFLVPSVLYPIVIFPLTWVVRKIANPLVSRIIILILSVIGGYIFFQRSYNERFVMEYHLNSSTAIILFGVAGFIYVLADYYMERQVNKVDDK